MLMRENGLFQKKSTLDPPAEGILERGLKALEILKGGGF